MANVTGVTKHFAVAKEGFTTTTSATIAPAATTVPLNSVTGYSNGDVVVLVIDGDDIAKKQVFTGTVDTTGVQITNVVWTEGSNTTHTAGASVVDYVAATHQGMTTKGILEEHNQDGTHSDIHATSVTSTGVIEATEFRITGAGGDKGWSSGLPTPDTITYNGNRSYDLVFNSTDLTDTLSPGMRFRTTRTVTAPIQCTDLESGSSQYWSKSSPTGISFTDDFTCMAWIKLESYTTNPMIISRLNSAGTQGWYLRLTTAGQVNIAGASTTDRAFSSYQSIPLGKWVHVAATLDMSAGTSTIYIDGVSVPVTSVGGTQTALTQAGDLMVGNFTSATSYFDGKIAQAAVFSSVLSAATIRSYASQTLAGNESTCVALFKMDGNGNDSNANANNLSASGSATATNADSPFSDGANLASGYTDGTTDFGIVTKASFSTNTTLTVQVPEGCTIPTSGGVSAVAYSAQRNPYGFPGQRGKWRLTSMAKNLVSNGGSVSPGTWLNVGYRQFYLPIGSWVLGFNAVPYYWRTGTSAEFKGTLSTANNTESNTELTVASSVEGASGTMAARNSVNRETDVTISSATQYYLNVTAVNNALGDAGWLDSYTPGIIYAENAYV